MGLFPIFSDGHTLQIDVYFVSDCHRLNTEAKIRRTNYGAKQTRIFRSITKWNTRRITNKIRLIVDPVSRADRH